LGGEHTGEFRRSSLTTADGDGGGGRRPVFLEKKIAGTEVRRAQWKEHATQKIAKKKDLRPRQESKTQED